MFFSFFQIHFVQSCHRKNKSTQIDSVVQNGRRKHIEYLNEKINSYYKLMTHNELFYLYLSNEDTADGELLNWLEELGFTYTEKANVLQHDNVCFFYFIFDLEHFTYLFLMVRS